jgi:hypothetical protein
MTAFAVNPENAGGVSGCSGWGTAGVLCAMGVLSPDRRFGLFVLAIAMVLVGLVDAWSYSSATGSVFGVIGASFFGWSWCGMWLTSAVTASMATLPSANQQSHPIHDGNFYDSNKHHDGVRRTNQHSNNHWGFWNVISAFVVVNLWLLPILYLRFGSVVATSW